MATAIENCFDIALLFLFDLRNKLAIPGLSGSMITRYTFAVLPCIA